MKETSRFQEFQAKRAIRFMPSKPPAFAASSFSCPHCNAVAHQDWFEIHANECSKENPPRIWTQQGLDRFQKDLRGKGVELSSIDDLSNRIRSSIAGFFQLKETQGGIYSRYVVDNLYLTRCYSCNEISAWRRDELLWPKYSGSISPVDQMPPDVKVDFLEASSIVHVSPRGASALLRLAIQKLCVALGCKGKNINEDIASLVAKGLNQKVQKALDAVRVIGNESVHPGTIDLRDNKEIAMKLFSLVNFIVDSQIRQSKEIDEIYDSLPQGKIDAINQRDNR